MTTPFIQKKGQAITLLAYYLLTKKAGDRLLPVSVLAKNYALSVGVVQTAIKLLETENIIILQHLGRNGSFISAINYPKLLKQAKIEHLVCTMPLPYTKNYEGLASGLKAQLNQFPIYFSHMRGADSRLECLYNGVFDFAITSRLAAQHFHDDLMIALSLGPHTYVKEHQIICRKNQSSQMTKVGIDYRSTDQRQLSEFYFHQPDIRFIDISYNNGLSLINKGVIDAMIWNKDMPLDPCQYDFLPLHGKQIYEDATEAVILTRKDQLHLASIIQHFVDINALIAHQNDVIHDRIYPNY